MNRGKHFSDLAIKLNEQEVATEKGKSHITSNNEIGADNYNYLLFNRKCNAF